MHACHHGNEGAPKYGSVMSQKMYDQAFAYASCGDTSSVPHRMKAEAAMRIYLLLQSHTSIIMTAIRLGITGVAVH